MVPAPVLFLDIYCPLSPLLRVFLMLYVAFVVLVLVSLSELSSVTYMAAFIA